MGIERISEKSKTLRFNNAVCRKYCIKKSITVSVILLLIGVILSPRYLVYSDPPGKSDIIVLFVGPDQEARLREARHLVQEGYSDYLFIPTLSSLFQANQDRTGLTSIQFADIKHGSRSHKGNGPAYFQKTKSEYHFPGYFEDTHAEILLAKRAMNACGLRSAIFVSSPYHMERIRMITKRVFGERARYISYVPTQYENDPIDLRDMDWGDWVFVIREYIKICWFSLYSPFL
jgi:uncharacterized SAM-binding protein YcdF (DUF218 family)